MQKVKEKSNWKGETIVEIEIERLKAFHNHPFQVRDDDDLEKLKESIKMYGVDLRHINHNALIGSDRSHKLADLSCMNWAYGHAPHTGDTFAFVGF